MADNKNIRGPQDRKLISLSEDHEIRYWTESLGVSEARLRESVKEHGNSAEKIRAALNKAA